MKSSQIESWNIPMKIILILILFVSVIKAQVGFFQANTAYRGETVHKSFTSGGAFDLNGDKLPDMLIMDNGKNLIIGYNKGEGNLMKWDTVARFDDVMFALTIGDLDNDGENEIIAGGILTGIFSYKKDENGKYQLFQSINPQREIFSQASNLVDINRDGYLDFFVCNDIGLSRIYINDGTGLLLEQNIIDFNTVPASNNSGSYGSDWADINGDDYPDLYIAKCKAGVTDPTDPRRVNMFFLSDANGNYKNLAQELGIASGAQSWTAAFADIDNDGDFDIIVTNHDSPHSIYINDGSGHFVHFDTNISNYAFQCLVADYDNNGFLDFYLPGADRDIIVFNHGDLNFESIVRPLNAVTPFSGVFGDINNDGFEDLIVSYARSLDLPGNLPDMIWINSKNENNWLRIYLQGSYSNRTGVGAVARLYGRWGVMTRILKAGESYGITTPDYIHFGLAKNDHIDSLVILWPSGTKQIFTDLDINKRYHITEGICISEFIALQYEIKDYFCGGETLYVSSPLEFEQYLWSNGSTESNAQVVSPDILALSAVDSSGCTFISDVASFNTRPLNLNVIPQDLAVICNNQSLMLSAIKGFKFYEWSNGENNQNILISTPGTYKLTVRDECGDEVVDQIVVSKLFSTIDQIQHATVQKGMDASITVNALGRVDWFLNYDDTAPFYTGNTLEVINAQESDTFYVQNTNFALSDHILGPEVASANLELPLQNLNSGLVLYCEKNLFIREFKVRLPLANPTFGPRRFLLQTFQGDTLFSTTVDINTVQPFVVPVNWELKPGVRYVLTTDGDFNLEQRGVVAPGLLRTNNNVQFPYRIENALSIERSLHGTSTYYYFYEIKVNVVEDICESSREPAFLNVIPSNIEEPVIADKSLWKIAPNPANQFIRVLHPYYQKDIEIEMTDFLGRKIFSKSLYKISEDLNISDLSVGVYFLRLKTPDNLITTLKWLKISK